jgi:TET-associated glycosyltransferase-like protein
MTRYSVAIPSYRRADMLAKRTLPFLLEGGVSPNDITVFVHSHDPQYRQYVATLIGFPGVGIQVTEAHGINAQRAAILDHYTEGDALVQVDDDVTALMCTIDGVKLTRVDDVDGFFRRAFALTRERGLWSWGLSAVPNAYFMKPGHITEDLKFLIFSLFGTHVRHGHPVFTSTVPTKDDYEFSLRSWWYDGGVIRFNDHVAKADIYRAPGGCQDTRTVEQAEWSVESLIHQWPGLVRRNTRRRSDFPEILLARRARHAGHSAAIDPPGIYRPS